MASAPVFSTSHNKKYFSKPIILSSDPNELCERIKLLQQQKEAGNNSDIFNREIFAITDKLLDYKCISAKEHEFYYLNV